MLEKNCVQIFEMIYFKKQIVSVIQRAKTKLTEPRQSPPASHQPDLVTTASHPSSNHSLVITGSAGATIHVLATKSCYFFCSCFLRSLIQATLHP